MKVLARIPLLDPSEASPPVAAPPRVEPRGSSRRRRHRPFPVASVAVLAVLAAMAWSLATWNDARRLHRHRLARTQQSAATGTVAR